MGSGWTPQENIWLFAKPFTGVARWQRQQMGSRSALVRQLFSDQKSQLQRLLVVEPRVAVRVIAIREIALGHLVRTAGAFGHVLARHLEMDAAGVRAFGLDDVHEVADFRQDALERTGLVSRLGLFDISVHRVRRPHDFPAFSFNLAHELRQPFGHLVRSEPRNQRQPSRNVVRVQDVDQSDQFIRIKRRTALHADRIANAAAELDVCVVRLPGPVANPHHVGRRVVELTRPRGILPRQRLLVTKKQGLVRGVELGLRQRRRCLRRDAASRHELHGVRDARRQRPIALSRRRVIDEPLHPLVDVHQAGIAALRERAQQIERRCGLGIGL